MPVKFSLWGDLLRYSNPQWVASLVCGARMARFAAGGLLLSLPILILVRVVAGFLGREPDIVMLEVFAIGLLLAFLALLSALVVVTTPNPVELPNESVYSARRVCRACASLVWAITVGIVYLLTMNPAVYFLIASATAFVVIGIVGTTAYWRYLRTVGRRLGHSRLIHDADFAYTGFAFSTASLICCILLRWQMAASGFAECAIPIALLGILVSGFLLLIATAAIVDDLQHARRQAERALDQYERSDQPSAT